MNLDSLSFALSQITYSVANLTKKNYKSSVAEISHLISLHNFEADRHLFRCLFSFVDFGGDAKSSGKDFHQTQYLISECAALLTKPNFVSTLCYALDNPLHHQKSLKLNSHLFPSLTKTLKLSLVQEVAFALALLHSSKPEIKNLCQQHLRVKLPILLKSYIESESGGQQSGLLEIPFEILHLLLVHLIQETKSLGIAAEQKEAFISNYCRHTPRDRLAPILAPLIYPELEDPAIEKLPADTLTLPISLMSASLADQIRELGPNITNSFEECRSTLTQLGIRELTPATLARIISMMVTHPLGDGDAIQLQSMSLNPAGTWNENRESPDPVNVNASCWNADIFVQVVRELVPHLNWREVVAEMDHSGFLVSNKKGLILMMQALRRGLQDVFPIELLYRQWNNTDGQLSWIKSAMQHPDVFCLADHPMHVVNTDMLKTPPDEENRDVAMWKSTELVETLIHLSEHGHYQEVMDMFKFPLNNCPDLLILALLQINSSGIKLKHDLISLLIPIFLATHANSGIILHFAWHCQSHSSTVRTLIMHAMAEWYMREPNESQTRLSRILDVAQDLKALSMLLNATPFAFVIDLACLASRRGYLKLDKWLGDKIRDHGEPFVKALVHFLTRRCPELVSTGSRDENALSNKASQLPVDQVALLLHCLQPIASSLQSKETAEIIRSMVSMAMLITNSRQPPVLAPTVPPSNKPAHPIGLQPDRNIERPALPTSSQVGKIGAVTSAMGAHGSIGGGYASISQSFSSPASTPTKSSNANMLGQVLPSNGSYNAMSITSQFQGLNVGQSMGSNSLSSQSHGRPNLGQSTFVQSNLSSSLSVGHNTSPSRQVLFSASDRFRSSSSSSSSLPDGAMGFPLSNSQFSKEVENEANSNFQRIFNQPPHPTLSIDHVLALLKQYKDSNVEKEQQVFACMLRNLFEEYRFFPQYPEKELHTTAVLFGGIIEQGLVTYMDLGIALRYVLEALKKPHGSKIYYFGIAALDRFKTRLKDYPQYCTHLAGIPHFSQFLPVLQEYIEYGAKSEEPPKRIAASLATQALPNTTPTTTILSSTVTAPTTATNITTSVSSSAITSNRPSIANTTNIDTLLAGTEGKEEYSIPPEELQDRVFFIFNNLSLMNIEEKAREMEDISTDEYNSWLAQYLVMKRASIEPNFHSLYANFVDHLKSKTVYTYVVDETFRNIKVLLQSDKGVANFSDRSLLKNLGHWLGMLTLAKNKPILFRELDLKSLLYEAHYNGAQELLYVVPFVAKVLESCSKSKVFKSPNPWTMAIMRVLVELHQDPDLKLNLKFEIEVLCKTLSIDINEVKPAVYVKDLSLIASIKPQLSAPSLRPQTITPQPEEPMGMGIASVMPSAPTPPQPRFQYQDISVMSLGSLVKHIVINEQITLFHSHPQLKQCVRQVIERAVQDLLPPVVDRSIKIAMTTCEQIVKKDFALDPEEVRMRQAAHHMVRNMTAGMALITCREPLTVSITNNLKAAFQNAATAQPHKDLIEQAATVIAQDNTELACAFIQKTAIEKAIPEMDKRLSNEYEMRKMARNEGRRYCDTRVLTYQAERMPEQIRLKVGGVSPQQLCVYDEFARNIPGFKITSSDLTPSHLARGLQQPASNVDEIWLLLEKVAQQIDTFIRTSHASPNNPQMSALNSLHECVLNSRHAREATAVSALIQKTVEQLLEGLMSVPQDQDLMLRFRDSHLLVLRAINDQRGYGPAWTRKEITRYLIECREESRYNVDAVELLLKSQLIMIAQYDLHLTQSMENGLNYVAISFAMQLLQRLHADAKNECELHHTIDSLSRIGQHSRQAPEGLMQLIESIRQHAESASIERTSTGPMSMMQSGISQAREFDDPPGLHDKTEFLLREWVSMYHNPNAGRDSTKAFSAFVGQMHQQGILRTDDLITRFFRLCTEMCVDLCYGALTEQTHSPLVRAKCFHTLDAFVRLIALLVKHSGETSNTVTKINLLNKVLGIVAGVLLQDHEVRNNEFQQLPYHRIFIMLFIELNAPEHILDSINFQVLNAFCNTFHILRPSKAPGFAYAWLELVSHRVFIGRMLAITPQQRVSTDNQAWNMYAQLLIDLFRFLYPFLRNADLIKPTQLLYKGMLRVLLVLLHDFPEFLCDYHYALCDVIPPNCVQMRNLILSAFPRCMRLPDPFTPNLKVDMLPEISQPPRIMANFASIIQPNHFRKDLDSYLKSRSPVNLLSELRGYLTLSGEPGMRYNIPLMNALVLYVGTQAISHISSKQQTPSLGTIAHSSHMDILQNLAVDLDTEGCYLFLNAIANQLRYPNSHTHYFSCTLLYLFAEANTEAIREQITRVLLERLIVNRPHPWGLLITFIELIKNPTFKFWNYDFVHCAPEIEKLFESLARSCMQPRQPQTPRESES